MGIFENTLSRLGYGKNTTIDNSRVKSGGEWSTASDAFAQVVGGNNWNQNFSSFNNQKQQLQSYTDWVYVAAHAIAQRCSPIDLRIFENHTGVKNGIVGSKLLENPRKAAEWKLRKTNYIYQKNGEWSYKAQAPALEELESHPLLDLLNCPNPFMVKNEFMELTFLHLGLTGEAFWCINRDKKGTPIELWPLMPNLIQVVPDKTHFVVGYLYTVNGSQVPFSPDDIIHHKYANPMDFHRGFSPVMAGARTVDTDAHAADYNRKFFYNQAAPDGVLSTDSTLDDRSFKRIKAEWQDIYGGTANAHRTAILEAGLKYQQVSLSQKDMDFLNARNFNRDQILAIFGVPKSIIGLDESMSRANAEAAKYVFTEGVIRPNMQRLTNRITEDLAPQFGNNLLISFTDPVPEDKEFLLQESQAALGIGGSLPWVTQNEERAKRGDPLIPGGDELLVPNTFVTLGSLLEDPVEQDAPSDAQEEEDNKPNLDDSEDNNSSDDQNSGDSSNSGSGSGGNDLKPSSADTSGSTSSETTNDGGSANPKSFSKKKRLPVMEGCTRCGCCDGYGEHDTGYECYRCDASGSVNEKEAKEPVPCEGRKDSPELWIDDDGNYRHAEEKKGVPSFPKSSLVKVSPMRQPENVPAIPFPPAIPEATVMSEPTEPQDKPIDDSDSKPTAAGDNKPTDYAFPEAWTSDMMKYYNNSKKLAKRFGVALSKASGQHFQEQKHEVLHNLNIRFAQKSVKPKRKDTPKQQKTKLNNLFDQAKSATAWSAALVPIYSQLGKQAGDESVAIVNNPVKYGFNATAPSVSQTFNNNSKAIQTYYNNRAGTISKGIDEETDKQLKATLTEGLSNNEGLAQLSDRVENVYGAASGYRATRIARTEAQTVLNQINNDAWEQTKLIESYQWVTGPDPCPICAPLEGKIATTPDDFPDGPPILHVNCECRDVPYAFVNGVTIED